MVVFAKPGKKNKLLVLFDEVFQSVLLPNKGSLVLLLSVEFPNTDEPDIPLRLPNMDGLLSYCDTALTVGDDDSMDVLSSFAVDICFSDCDFTFSMPENRRLLFSHELNGAFDVDVVDDNSGAKKTNNTYLFVQII